MKARNFTLDQVKELLIRYEMGKDYKKTGIVRAIAEIKIEDFIKKNKW